MEFFVSFFVVIRNTARATQAFERAVDRRGDLALRDHMTNKSRPYDIKDKGDQVTGAFCGVSLLHYSPSFSLGDSKTHSFE